MVEPTLALVRPRVIGSDGVARPLDDVIDALLAHGTKGGFVIIGPHGSGKTTAIRHLAATLELQLKRHKRCRFVDSEDWLSTYVGRLDVAADVTIATSRSSTVEWRQTLPLARWADLSNARLADIDWENADLRHANLRGATFHMGSSRGGLVFSPYACEGSKTGFYTDEFDEQNFKAPEDIRKASLRGADLRGANLTGVDFYLVDLRNAKLDAGQLEHVRSSGAILTDRVID